MKTKGRLTMKHIYFLAPLLLSTSLNAMTLQEAIKTSIENNPKTVANQLRVQAMEDRLKAQKVNWLPTATAIVGSDLSTSKYSTAGLNRTTNGRDHSASLVATMTIYDGGANKFATQEAEAELKAMKARYSSSNALIPNTRGSIANGVMDAYAGLLQVIEQKKYLGFLSSTLAKFAPGFTGDDLVLIQQRINDLKTSHIRTDFNYQEALKDFKYFATVPAPPTAELDTIEQAIDSLIIPHNAEEAFRIALEKNPNIKTAEYDAESSKLGYEAGKARRSSPLIYAQAAVTKGNGAVNDISNRSTSSSVGIYLSYTLDGKNKHLESAGLKNVEAAKRDLDGMIDETKHTIDSVYPSLQNQLNIYRSQLENLKVATESLNQILVKIKNGEFVDINVALNILSSHQSYTQQCLDLKISILYTRFRIQRTVGTLFDQLGEIRSRR